MKILFLTNKKRFLSIVVIIFLTIIISAVYVIHHHTTYFTVTKWASYSWNDRQILVKSFLKQYKLDHLSKDEIIDLLGSESEFTQSYSIPNKTQDNMVYDFGLMRNAKASNISLIICLDENEQVTSYELKTYSQ